MLPVELHFLTGHDRHQLSGLHGCGKLIGTGLHGFCVFGTQDLKIENTTDAPLYIESYVNGDGELVCTIYGQETRDEGRKLSFRSETEEEEDPNVIYEEDTSLAAGRTRVKEQGAAKSTVTLIKVIEEDGRETEEEMGTSVYQASDRVVSVGTRTNDDEIKQALKEAAAAQDEEAVEAAVRQARNQ